MFFLTKMKLEEATGLCGARQHRWLRQGYEGINGTAEKMSKACPAKKNREVTQKKRNLGKLKFLTLAMAQKQVPIDWPPNLPYFSIGPSKFNDPISFERQPSCFLQLHRFWNRVILANGTLFTHVCTYGVYIYIYIYYMHIYIYIHIKTEVMLHPQIGGFPTGFKHLQTWCV